MKLPLSIILAIVIGYVLSWLLIVNLNPEVAFWHTVSKRRLEDVTLIRSNSDKRSVIFFTGGSSTAFSINPRIIEEETGHQAVNLGLPVSAGAQFILHQALRIAETGDVIIVSTEPDLLTYADQESSPSKIGFALEARRGTPWEAAGGSTFDRQMSLADYLNLLRPGPDYIITLAGRTLTGKGYRYKLQDIQYRGLIQTQVRDSNMIPLGPRGHTRLHDEGRNLLQMFCRSATLKGVELVYAMPLTYTTDEDLRESREKNRQLLADIATIMPVIDDGHYGALSGIQNFSDGPRHLSANGSALRSSALAKAIKHYLIDR